MPTPSGPLSFNEWTTQPICLPESCSDDACQTGSGAILFGSSEQRDITVIGSPALCPSAFPTTSPPPNEKWVCTKSGSPERCSVIFLHLLSHFFLFYFLPRQISTFWFAQLAHLRNQPCGTNLEAWPLELAIAYNLAWLLSTEFASTPIGLSSSLQANKNNFLLKTQLDKN